MDTLHLRGFTPVHPCMLRLPGCFWVSYTKVSTTIFSVCNRVLSKQRDTDFGAGRDGEKKGAVVEHNQSVLLLFYSIFRQVSIKPANLVSTNLKRIPNMRIRPSRRLRGVNPCLSPTTHIRRRLRKTKQKGIPITTPVPWSMKKDDPISAPGWMSIAVFWWASSLIIRGIRGIFNLNSSWATRWTNTASIP